MNTARKVLLFHFCFAYFIKNTENKLRQMRFALQNIIIHLSEFKLYDQINLLPTFSEVMVIISRGVILRLVGT